MTEEQHERLIEIYDLLIALLVEKEHLAAVDEARSAEIEREIATLMVERSRLKGILPILH